MQAATNIRQKIPCRNTFGGALLPGPIVLLPGWGFDSRIWQPLEACLSTWAELWLVDLNYQEQTLASLCTAVTALLPEKAVLCGWSLGAMLAIDVALNLKPAQNKQLKGLIALAANLQFIADPHWPHALAAETYTAFNAGLKDNPSQQLKRFLQLVAYGDIHSRKQLPWLAQHIADSDCASNLLTGLDVLASINLQPLEKTLKVPALALAGECDVLMPAAALASIRHPLLQTEVLSQRGHCLHYPAGACEPYIQVFLEQLSRAG